MDQPTFTAALGMVALLLLGNAAVVVARAPAPEADVASAVAVPVVDVIGAAPTSEGFDASAFRDPPPAARPTAFWFLNDELDHAELAQQLTDIADQGFSQVIVHAREGLGGSYGASEEATYLSEEWFEAVRLVLNGARALGLTVLLYDELNWPSGQAGGRVLGGGSVGDVQLEPAPDLVAKVAVPVVLDVTGPHPVAWRPAAAAQDRPIVVSALPVVGDAACAERDRPAAGARLDGRRAVALSPDAADGVVRWDAPPGRWCLVALVQRPLDYRPEREQDRPYVDLLDPRVAQRVLATTHAEYVRRFPEHVGTTIRGFYNDEPGFYGNLGNGRGDAAAEGSIPWTPGLRAWLRDRTGTDLARDLPALWFDVGDRTTTTRVAWSHALQRRWVESYLRPLHDWAAGHGLAIVANPVREEDLGDHRLAGGGSLYRVLRWYQVPGMDTIDALDLESVTPKVVSSAAHVFSRPRTLAEAFGAFGWDLTFGEMRRVATWQAVGGVDLLNQHALYQSIDGERADDSPPPQSSQSQLWPWMPQWISYVGRLHAPAVAARAVNPIAVLYPTSALAAEGTPLEERGVLGNSPALAPVDDAWRDTGLDLMAAQLDFDYVDEQVLAGDPAFGVQPRVADAVLRIGDGAYTALVWPRPTVLSLEAVATAARFVASGGTLVAVGPFPEREARGRDAELRVRLEELFRAATAHTVASGSDLDDVLREAVEPDVLLDPGTPHVRVRHVRRGGEDAWLLVNTSAKRVRLRASVAAVGIPELWDVGSGTTRIAPGFDADGERLVVPVDLAAHGAVWLVVRPGSPDAVPHVTSTSAGVVVAVDPAAAQVHVERGGRVSIRARAAGVALAGTAEAADVPAALTLDGSWTTRIGGGAPAQRLLGSWTDVAPRHSGSATYERAVTVPRGWLGDGVRVELDLGAVHDIAEVEVNGVRLPALLWSPHRLDVTDALAEGANHVRVTVTNTQENARGARTLPSGLLGPVRLVPSRIVTVPLRPA